MNKSQKRRLTTAWLSLCLVGTLSLHAHATPPYCQKHSHQCSRTTMLIAKASRKAEKPKLIPPPPKKTKRIVSFALIGAGLAVAVGGAIVVGFATAADARMMETYETLKTSSSSDLSTDDIIKAHQEAQLLNPLGWSIVFGGLGLAVVGAVLLSTEPTPPPKGIVVLKKAKTMGPTP